MTSTVSTKSSSRLDHLDKSGTVFAEMTTLANTHKAINLGQGFPTLPVPSFIRQAASDAVANECMGHQYTRSEGNPRLVNVLSKFYADKIGRVLNPLTEIITTVGATEAIYTSMQALVSPGDEVILMQPFYDSYPAAIELSGGKPVVVNLAPTRTPAESSADWKLDINELRRAVTKKTKAIFINNPHNPVGKVWTREELLEVGQVAQEFDLVVISDEVYETLVFSDSPEKMVKFACLPGMFERTITLGSIGKMFGVTGWKIGWCLGPADLIRSCWMIHQFNTFAVVTPLQEAAAASLEKAIETTYFADTVKTYQTHRDHLVSVLARNGLKPTIPHGGYFVMADTTGLKLPKSLTTTTSTRRDYRACHFMTTEIGVTAIPPSAFYERKVGAGGDVPGRHARFAFCKGLDLIDGAGERLDKYFGDKNKRQKI
ncbi:Kynurenine--oxoglutarate transaminase 3 [Physocladia obscura]|uniref:Kynurenine--oxoglutarate transaminase 3 n=1 Tax=Physocladia obscura TaxID=109957 RepID=A0AAD5SVC2_9FUNG|nr:Kynurenine--oxoglutarate transaminase 3 [Physocladia obscura]